MTTKKYQTTLAIVLGSLLMTMSCNENSNAPSPSNSNVNARVNNYTFDGTEGDPITLEVATRWIDNYVNQNGGTLTAHFFGRKVLEKTLSKNGCIGIRFYYSIDNSAKPTTLLIGTGSDGENLGPMHGIRGKEATFALTSTASLSSSLADTEGDSISRATSHQWVINYNQKKPTGIQAHFFGNEIIKQILSQSGCIGIRTYYALNDAGVQQLLLVGVIGSGKNMLPLSSSINAKVTSDGGTVADMSTPCPVQCSSGGSSL